MRTIYVFDTRLTNDLLLFLELLICYASHIFILYLFYKHKDTAFGEVKVIIYI